MKKLVLITALITTASVAVPAMADNGRHKHQNGNHVFQNASNHKYIKYNNGNAYGKHKAKKPVAKHGKYRHTQLKKWPVPTTPNTNPARHMPSHR